MAQKVFINVTAKTLRVRPSAENPGVGETLLGTIDHDAVTSDDSQGWKSGHVIYQHVEELMNKAGHLDHHLYKIIGYKPVTGVGAGPDFTVTASAGANHTRQLAPAIIPADTSEAKTFTYASSDATKATVNASGLVTGVAVGSATITVTSTSGDKTDTVLVTVTA